MNIILWILIGGVMGWTFGHLIHKRTKEARGAYVLLGALGSLTAALIAGQISDEPVISWFDIWLVVIAILGAAIVTGAGYAFMRTRHRNH